MDGQEGDIPIHMGFAPSQDDQEAVKAEHERLAALQKKSIDAECVRALATAAKELAQGAQALRIAGGACVPEATALAQAAARIAEKLEPDDQKQAPVARDRDGEDPALSAP